MTTLPRVRITAKQHPHYGEYGRFTGHVVSPRWAPNTKMAEVKLESCKHGTDSCFVSPGEIREVGEDDQYV